MGIGEAEDHVESKDPYSTMTTRRTRAPKHMGLASGESSVTFPLKSR